jgi:hypothetical protein
MTPNNWLTASKATCSHCHAQPGEPCVGEHGDPLQWAPTHITRLIAAENAT